ncbi:MAG: ATP-binding protein [bacterium]|nr:ATP-binding protein [bacterium]
MKFVNREHELSLLTDIYHRDESQMLILYGRRRIGKTALIDHWLNAHIPQNAIYWVAHKSSSDMLLEKFSRVVQPCLPNINVNFRFADWESAIQQVFEVAKQQKVVLAIDEFPYLLESVPGFSSILQAIWDQQAGTSQLMLILSGSHYHMMFKEFLSGKGPLYGRSTADLLLEEIEPSSMRHFLPRYSSEQIVETYSLIGGVPKYLEMWDDRKPVLHNVEHIILSPVTIFRQEAIFLIQDEIPEPRTYLAILEAIGRGMKSPSALAKQTGIAINHIGKYVHTLLELGFIRRVISLDAPNYSNTRLSRYEIKDSYLKFYFHYIYPHLEFLEQRRIPRLLDLIQAQHASFVGKTGFEELARRHLIQLGDAHQLSFVPDYVGRVWNKQAEIDVVATSKTTRTILLGECKWSKSPVNEVVLDRLVQRATLLPRIRDYKIHYALFSKSGFTTALMNRACKEHILLFKGANFEQIT